MVKEKNLRKSNIVTVYQLRTGQFRVTIPKSLAEAKGIKNKQRLEWRLTEYGELLLLRVKEE